MTDACTIPNCDRKRYAKGWCNMHWHRWKRHGDPLITKRRANGEGSLRRGYVIHSESDHPNATADGKILAHRLVMSEYLGRPLYAHETVHHINGDRSDNRIENLELWSGRQPKGQRVEDLAKWAVEFLSQYPEMNPWVS